MDGQIPAPEQWPSTRDLSDPCDLNIYQGRKQLLKLVALGIAQRTARSVNNSLRWFITDLAAQTPYDCGLCNHCKKLNAGQ
ncbi:hypothetical protein BSQ40_24235 [Serratia fonticola]|nr:hypothetical protein BSQ40_24235 [Serratia fonticola]